jgi:hypothetical protein
MELEIIKRELYNYLEFDSEYLFSDKWGDGDYACIFGGAIRDIVAGDSDKISDIDILALSRSVTQIYNVLFSFNYKRIDLVKPDIHHLYTDIKYIFEPITLINPNQKIVQIIRPSQVFVDDVPIGTFDAMTKSYFELLKNVDLSSSGLFYDGEEIYESIQGAYTHCKSKVFEELTDAMMYKVDRTFKRKQKLVHERHWFQLVEKNGGLEPMHIIPARRLKFHSLRKYKIKSIDDYIKKLKYDK